MYFHLIQNMKNTQRTLKCVCVYVYVRGRVEEKKTEVFHNVIKWLLISKEYNRQRKTKEKAHRRFVGENFLLFLHVLYSLGAES